MRDIITISLPSRLRQAVDEDAKLMHCSRSALILAALKGTYQLSLPQPKALRPTKAAEK